MTVSLGFITVVNSISQLSFPGINVKDLDRIPQDGSLVLPVFYPRPDNFMTDWMPDTISVGTAAIAAINATYTLHYVFLFTDVGAGLSQLDVIPALGEAVKDILTIITENDVVTGLVDVKAVIESMGVLQDATGAEYWGALIALQCLEYVQ